MPEHRLTGLRPEPLASYLAGLGLVRVLAEQADPDLTARWDDDTLVVQTTVDDIAAWLTDHYAPTPVLSPWNEGSGFGVKDKKPREALDTLTRLSDPRLDPIKQALAAATIVGETFRSDGGWSKERAIVEYRNTCPESALPWIDAAVVLTGDQVFYPPILGTGGNDGRLDFSTNFHQRLVELFDTAPAARDRSRAAAQDLVDGTQIAKLSDGAIGQFDPAGAGGPGSSPFGASAPLVNPWRFVMMVEGSLLFAAAAVRRNQHSVGRAAMPFTVFGSAEGPGSGADGESSRGEIWAPLWSEPFTFEEIRQLFTDARASWRGRPVSRSVEFYAATRTLGVSRGIDGFSRYGLHQRNGLAFAAVPLERVAVTHHPEVELAARLEEWVGWVRRGDTSNAVAREVRRFDAAHHTFVRDGGGEALLRLLATLTNLDQAVGRSGRLRGVVPVRRPPVAAEFLRWLPFDGPEVRLGAGIASCAVGHAPSSRAMRHLLLPIAPERDGLAWRDSALVPGFMLRPLRAVLTDVLVWLARTTVEDPGGRTVRGVLTFRAGVRVPTADAHAFATVGALDERRLNLAVLACLALDWRGVRHHWSHPGAFVPVPPLGLVQPFAHGLGEAGRDSEAPVFGLAPDWPARLAAGQVAGVVTDAARRLRRAGWRAPSSTGSTQADRLLGQHVAAALVPRVQQPLAALSDFLAERIVTTGDTSLNSSTADNVVNDVKEMS